MSYITKEPAYAIATGDTIFPSMQTKGSKNTLTVVLSALDSNDAEIEVEQSPDEVNWGLIPGSTKILAAVQTSHQWNISNLPGGMFVRVVLRKGTATAGIIHSLKLVTNE